MRPFYRPDHVLFDLDVHCRINEPVHFAIACLFFWFYGYPKPTAAACARSY